ncbi:tyrosine-type recombinase/integrase [Nitrosomonas sp. Is37]|uniref:tyrosine-type recombinase/integrase n=1 Tax=Nitrosomonas sp. Is37 TaxID=3080535 RepID=UPI00294AAB78|nr:tyrosine-type recombinase/integrase [Nitrosomonas sp. Is37]MDV6345236.1 tyrosine-type recombinase/integrase [Nitrosomonas sp. Is37]
MRENDIVDGSLQITQDKTGKKLRISIEGELKALIDRIKERKAGYTVRSLHLIVDESGQRFTSFMLRSHFDRAREQAGINKADFQFRDLRAKAGTDKADASGDIRQAQRQLGHASVVTTERYVRGRKGDKVKPTK